MLSSFHKRIQEILDHYGLSKNAFDKSIGMSNGYIGKQLRSEASIGSETIETILKNYKDINPSWLIVGEGTMFREHIELYEKDHFERLLLSYLDKPHVKEKIIRIITGDSSLNFEHNT